MKKAYSPNEISRIRSKLLPWGEKWSSVFGYPSVTETWFICGHSASGKSSFVMQLGKELCQFGRVLYVSYEEGVRASFRRRIGYLKMDEVQGNFRVVTNDSPEELRERLSKPKSARFVIIDSTQQSGMNYPELEHLVKDFPHKSIIFVSQERRGQPLGTAAVRLRYLAGVKVWVRGFKAFCQGRENENAGAYYPVWEEGIVRTGMEVTGAVTPSPSGMEAPAEPSLTEKEQL